MVFDVITSRALAAAADRMNKEWSDMLFEMTRAEAEAAEWAFFVAEATVENDPSSVSTRDLITRVESLRGRLSAKLSSEETANRLPKVSGVAKSQATATDIGLALNTAEGFEPVKLPPMEEVGRDPDGTPILRNNWGAYDPWIPVSERLPESGETVLVWHHGEVQMAWLNYFTNGVAYFVRDTHYNFEPTHWMPLPSPPGGSR